MVEKTEGDSKKHMDDSQDDRHFHLEGVEESQLVCGNVPYLEDKRKINTLKGSVCNTIERLSLHTLMEEIH